MRILRCAIEKVVEWHPHLFLEPHVVACVAVLGRHATLPATIEIECLNVNVRRARGAKQLRLIVSWSAELAAQAERLSRTTQRRQLVEMAALALAFLVAYRVLGLREWDVTRYGERVDYRSLQDQTVLEVSGTEVLKDLDRRHRQKVRQAAKNPWGYSSLVVVCGFSASCRIRVSHHPYLSVL